MDLIAINTIHRAKKPGKDATANTKAVPPEMEVIAPGESFSATAEEGDELIAMKSARKDTGAKKAPAKKAATNTKTSSAAAAKQQAEKGQTAPEDMTVADLKAELDELETEYASDALKDDLVKALTEARSGGLV